MESHKRLKYNVLRILTLGGIITSVTGSLSAGETFELIDQGGRAIEAEILEVTGDSVSLVRSGKRMNLALEKLSAENRSSLVAFAKQHQIFRRYPQLKVNITVRDRDRRQEGSSYMRDLWITPMLTIGSEARLKGIPEIDATMIVICANTKSRYVERDREYQIKGKEKIRIGAADDGEPRKFEFKPIKLEFDEDRDRSNVGGWVYKHYLCFLTDPESGAVVSYHTNYDVLESFLDKNPEAVKHYLSKGVEDDIPSKFD